MNSIVYTSYKFNQYQQDRSLYVYINCDDSTTQITSGKGQFEYVVNDKLNRTCASSDIPRIYGSGSCIRTSSSSSKRVN